MEVAMSEIIRETRNAVNSRLDMLEVLVSRYIPSANNANSGCDGHRFEYMNDKITNLNEKYLSIESTLYRFNDLLTNIQTKIESMEKQGAPIVSVMPSGKHYSEMQMKEPLPEIIVDDKEEIDEYSYSEHEASDETDNKIVHVVHVQEEVAEEKSAEEEVVEEAEEEVVEEEVAEEEALELEEFTYKGMTLYRDPENKVYQMDEDGAISEPLGLWDEAKQKIKKL